jgi:hypothetical protein
MRRCACARELAVPRAQADAIAEQLRRREGEVAGIEHLLEQAAIAREAGRLDGDAQAALPLYRRILELQPARNEALEGREDALSDLLQQAQGHLAKREYIEAADLVARVRDYDAGHVGLPDAQAALTQARDRERVRADRALRKGHLTDATAAYRAVRALDADDTAASDALARIAIAWAKRAERQASDFQFEAAAHSLGTARELAPLAPEIAAAERHLAQSRTQQARLPTVRVTPGRAAEVRRLVASAADAQARGDLLTPPGDSAYDRLLRARAIAPNDPAVKRALARLLPSAKACFDDALRANQLVRAQGCLDARVQLGDAAADLRAARSRLASRWIAVGEERLGAGELTTAQRALATARALDPSADGLAAFADRLRAAMGATQARP